MLQGKIGIFTQRPRTHLKLRFICSYLLLGQIRHKIYNPTMVTDTSCSNNPMLYWSSCPELRMAFLCDLLRSGRHLLQSSPWRKWVCIRICTDIIIISMLAFLSLERQFCPRTCQSSWVQDCHWFLLPVLKSYFPRLFSDVSFPPLSSKPVLKIPSKLKEFVRAVKDEVETRLKTDQKLVSLSMVYTFCLLQGNIYPNISTIW